tara:strand:+ start:197 stop:463 length:267 start_codon:yes stop_codon:yes gene_type:complete
MNKIGSKWNIGDLVTLSAAGRNADQNSGLVVLRQGKLHTVGFGVVVSHGTLHDRWPVRVQWFGLSDLGHHCNFKDYELKKFKADKKCP